MFDVVWRIERVAVDIDVVASTGVSEATLTGVTTAVLRLKQRLDATAAERLGCLVARVVVDAYDLHRVAALLARKRPETGWDMTLFVVGDDADGDDRLRALQTLQVVADLLQSLCRHVSERLVVDGEEVGVPHLVV